MTLKIDPAPGLPANGSIAPAPFDDSSTPGEEPDDVIHGSETPTVDRCTTEEFAEEPIPDLVDVPSEAARNRPAVSRVIDVHDLDWKRIRESVDPAAILAGIDSVVAGMEAFLDAPGGQGLLFDDFRAHAGDRAIHVTSASEAPLWIVGDLHGDLLALQAALALIAKSAEDETSKPHIILLGDLFDDEGFGLEVLLRVFALILESPERICLITGNHDEALRYQADRFTSTVEPGDFADFLNKNIAQRWIERAGKAAIRLFANTPCALFLPDGLLVAHGGFPLSDLHPELRVTGNWNDPVCLQDFIWTRAHPTARKKLPNRFSRGSQYGYEDLMAFAEAASSLGRPVTHFVRGHDHVEERYAIYPKYEAVPILTTVALSHRLPRESIGAYERVPTVARYRKGALPDVYRLHIPTEIIREVYPEATNDCVSSPDAGGQA